MPEKRRTREVLLRMQEKVEEQRRAWGIRSLGLSAEL